MTLVRLMRGTSIARAFPVRPHFRIMLRSRYTSSLLSCYGRMLLKITEEQRREAELILENSTIDEAVGLTGCSRYIIRCLLFDMDMQKLNVVKPPILDVQASLDDFAEQDTSEEVPSNHDVESDSSDQCEVTMLSYPVLATSWSGFYDVLPPVENTVSVAIEKAHSRAEGYG